MVHYPSFTLASFSGTLVPDHRGIFPRSKEQREASPAPAELASGYS
ncbi:hypothetical protein FAEPRAA2165_01661 [Faecalibacterium duncaniae]|uniref:Uncharacterized protein n=1 Tax=Faecalibacterium duncaniae (strain DSM 17677 / JCM 31915 / A2-165) TaxID=411483 RepID=C7H5T6_FAED2|nr:hypothetical protein FAEPRAA2165_01661 [Faecalibacterium duncaniae]